TALCIFCDVDTQTSGMEAGPRRRAPWMAVLLAVAGLALIVAGGWRGGAGGGPQSGAEHTVSVVVAARALDAGTEVGASDVTAVAVAASDPLAGLAHAPGEVVGRRLAIAVPAGAPLGGMLLSVAAAPAAGRRLVRVPVDANALAPDVVAGALVDVVAAAPQGPDGGRVVSVATAR